MNPTLISRIDEILKKELGKELVTERKKIGPIHKQSDLAWVIRAEEFWKGMVKDFPKVAKVKNQLDIYTKMKKELSK